MFRMNEVVEFALQKADETLRLKRLTFLSGKKPRCSDLGRKRCLDSTATACCESVSHRANAMLRK